MSRYFVENKNSMKQSCWFATVTFDLWSFINQIFLNERLFCNFTPRFKFFLDYQSGKNNNQSLYFLKILFIIFLSLFIYVLNSAFSVLAFLNLILLLRQFLTFTRRGLVWNVQVVQNSPTLLQTSTLFR